MSAQKLFATEMPAKGTCAQGFTLIELVASLLIMMLLLQGGLYISRKLLPWVHLTTNTNQVLGLLLQARASAMEHRDIMVCALGSDCQHFGADTHGLILVVDSNHDHQMDNGEKPLMHLHFSRHTRISWHSFRNRPRLTYRQGGLSYFQNGHLLLCGSAGASKVVVNRIGRPHTEEVTDFHRVCDNT
jgi:Tfp pilus assembly protein FimT